MLPNFIQLRFEVLKKVFQGSFAFTYLVLTLLFTSHSRSVCVKNTFAVTHEKHFACVVIEGLGGSLALLILTSDFFEWGTAFLCFRNI